MKSRSAFLGVLGVSAGSLVPRSTRAAEAYTLRLNSGSGATSAQVTASLRFAAAVQRRTNGQVKIEIYPTYQLAKETETVQVLSDGSVDFVVVNTAVLEPRFPRLQIFDVPFLFKDLSAGFRVLDGPIGASLASELESNGIYALCWSTSGMREVGCSSKAINTVDDMKGLRIRIQAGAVYVAMFQALGAIPIVIDTSEAYIALSQHTVDAIDNSIDTLTTQKYYTIMKHLAMTNQVFSVLGLYGSKRKIDAMPANLARIVKEEGKAVASFWREFIVKQTAADIEIMKQNGVAFTTPQTAAFRKAMEPVYATFRSKPGGEFIDRIAASG